MILKIVTKTALILINIIVNTKYEQSQLKTIVIITPSSDRRSKRLEQAKSTQKQTLTQLSQMEFPTVINWINPFLF